MSNPMVRIKVKKGTILKVWVEPNDEDAAREFDARISLKADSNTPVWTHKDISLTTKASPAETKLQANDRLEGTCTVIFAGDAQDSVTVWNRMVFVDAAGNEKPHGEPQQHTIERVNPGNNFVDLKIYMA